MNDIIWADTAKEAIEKYGVKLGDIVNGKRVTAIVTTAIQPGVYRVTHTLDDGITWLETFANEQSIRSSR